MERFNDFENNEATKTSCAFFYFCLQNKMKFFLLVVVLLFVACETEIIKLDGQWRLFAFYENGKDVSAPLDSVAISFSADGRYEFRTIGFYREAGPFRVSDNFLFLTDTTEHPAKERILKILFLSTDTLKLQMAKGEREQVLFLTKRL
jgi:hypothetical protein